MASKRGPKGPRNKVKQVVLIEGHPGCIFETKERASVSIIANGVTIKLGHMGPEKLDALKNTPGIKVIEEMKPSRRAKKLPSVMFVKTTKTSTQLTVGAVDKDALDKAVANLSHYLFESGVNIQERCRWVCEIDKGKQPVQQPVQPELKPVQINTPAVQPEIPSVQVKDRIMNYLKNKSSYNVHQISNVLNIPEDTVRKILIDEKFLMPGTKSTHEVDAIKTVRKGMYGTVTEFAYAPG